MTVTAYRSRSPPSRPGGGPAPFVFLHQFVQAEVSSTAGSLPGLLRSRRMPRAGPGGRTQQGAHLLRWRVEFLSPRRGVGGPRSGRILHVFPDRPLAATYLLSNASGGPPLGAESPDLADLLRSQHGLKLADSWPLKWVEDDAFLPCLCGFPMHFHWRFTPFLVGRTLTIRLAVPGTVAARSPSHLAGIQRASPRIRPSGVRWTLTRTSGILLRPAR